MRRVTKLSNQPVAAAEPRPRRRELRIAIDGPAIQLESLRPLREIELQLIRAQVQLVGLRISGRVLVDAILLPAGQRQRERVDDLFRERILQLKDLMRRRL